MLVVPDADGLLLVTQEAHAWLAGDLAARLRPGPWDRSAFVAAARVHDNGWREADAAPTVDGEGRPHAFTSLPDDAYEAVWRRGIARAAAVDPLVGLLVGLHGARFFGFRRSAGMRDLLAAERAREERVLADLGLGGTADGLPPAVRAASDAIALLDALSLQLCGLLGDRLAVRVAGTEHVLARTPDRVTVDPWPFADGGGPVPIPARRLPTARYPTDAALRTALAHAPPTTLGHALHPPSRSRA